MTFELNLPPFLSPLLLLNLKTKILAFLSFVLTLGEEHCE